MLEMMMIVPNSMTNDLKIVTIDSKIMKSKKKNIFVKDIIILYKRICKS